MYVYTQVCFNKWSGCLSVTGIVLLQAINLALDNFTFASWPELGLRSSKVRVVRVGLDANFMAYNIIYASEDYSN